jgi:hypothetical protein
MVTMIRTTVTLNVTLAEVPGNFLPIGQGDVVQRTSTVPFPGTTSGYRAARSRSSVP